MPSSSSSTRGSCRSSGCAWAIRRSARRSAPTVTRAPELLHGKTSLVTHSGPGVLAGLPDPFIATRYHSLAVVESTLPPEIEVTGRTESGVVMAMRHRELPIEGVQFHPESVLTQGGHLMLANWLAACGLPDRSGPGAGAGRRGRGAPRRGLRLTSPRPDAVSRYPPSRCHGYAR